MNERTEYENVLAAVTLVFWVQPLVEVVTVMMSGHSTA
jgi:hypothetical protein